MSKQVSAADLAAIVTKLLTDPDGAGHLLEQETFQGFMTEIATVVTDYCGGEVRNPADRFEDTFYVGIHGNDSLPADGGIWANVDADGELFPDDDDAATKQEMAEALGFSSVAEMHQHDECLKRRTAEHAAAVAYQGTAEAHQRKVDASKEFGIPVEAFIWVEPVERSSDQA